MKYHSQYIKLFYRYLSEKITPILIKFGISANFISFIRIFVISIASYLIIADSYLYWLISCFLIFLFSFFDALDGSIASKTKKSSLGLWLDPLFDRLGLLILISAISFYFYINDEIILIFVPYLTLFFYYQRSLIGSDIRTKTKFEKFKEIYTQKDNEKKANTIEIIRSTKIKFKNLLTFLFHQFAPHTHNQFLYIIIFLILKMIKIGMVFLLIINFLWYLYEVIKVTKISISIDQNKDE